MNKNNKGFGVVEGILIVVIIGLLGVVGFQFYQAQQKSHQKPKPSKTKVVKKEKKAPKGWIEFKKGGINFFHPDTWVADDNSDIIIGEQFTLKDSKSSLKAITYASQPRIYFSSNAPVFCRLDGQIWGRYSYDPNDRNNVTPDNTTDSCSDIAKETVNNQLVYTMAGGALGQYKYIAVIQVKGGYLVLEDYRNDAQFGGDTNVGTKEELKQSVDSLVQEITKVNRDMRRN